MLNKETRSVLLSLARESIAEHIAGIPSKLYRKMMNELIQEDLLSENGVFVTLKRRKIVDEESALRGCIGNIIGRFPLYESIRRLAVEAAVYDPRFQPVSGLDELNTLLIEISILTIPEQVSSYSEIVVGRDGVLLLCQARTAVFLPQVATEQGWDLEETLTHLSLKAGLGMMGWKDSHCQFRVFQTEVFSEKN
ncbi:MAG: AmmeMemoRadiSam system protein A [Bacteroidetes bacterium]|nr:AmmeMemoRadiSam system protein A [Bacteroidota bacterium]